MDFQARTDQGVVSLLTLPRADLTTTYSSGGSGTNDIRHNNNNGSSSSNGNTSNTKTTRPDQEVDEMKTSRPDPPKLMLLQAPAGYVERVDIQRLLKQSHLIVSKPNTDQPVVLVSDACHVSFVVSKVETSNSFILVPPLPKTPPLMMSTPEDSAEGSSKSESSSSSPTSFSPTPKKARITTTTTTSSTSTMPVTMLANTPARLVQPGGSGAYFLELKPKVLRLTELRDLFRSHHQQQQQHQAVFNPYNHNKNHESPTTTTTRGPAAVTRDGLTVQYLSHQLQQSQQEIIRGLHRLRAMPSSRRTCIHNNRNNSNDTNQSDPDDDDDVRYILLAEEIEFNMLDTIIFTLAEEESVQDYDSPAGIDTRAMVELCLLRMNDQERFEHTDRVLRHCLHQLMKAPDSCPDVHSSLLLPDRIRLDVAKVACCVARRLLLQRAQPWDEFSFFSQWQSHLPGVGDLYTVHPDMLRGLAIRIATSQPEEGGQQRPNNKSSHNNMWVYLPADQIMWLAPQEALDCLFRAKESWRLEELQPYLEGLMDVTGRPMDELLAHYTRAMTIEGREGAGVQIRYQRK